MLVAGEEEELLPEDGAVYLGALAVVDGDGRGQRAKGVGRGIDARGLEEEVCSSVILAGAGFEAGVDGAAGGVGEGCVVGRGDEADLSDEVAGGDVGGGDRASVTGFGSAVEGELGVAGLGAVDGGAFGATLVGVIF